MITTMNQRWTEKRDSYRPAGETIHTAEYEVAAIDQDKVAKAFVKRHHYSGSYPAARFRFGLYRHGNLVGVAVFSHPSNNAVLSIFPGKAVESVELGRLVLLDEVPGNAESWFIARCFELLRGESLVGVVSYSDPTPRQKLDGSTIFGGHVGTIYQASNAVFLGRGKKRKLLLLPDGRVMSERAVQKVRNRERGWNYSAGLLEAFGASQLTESMDSLAWLQEWLPRLTRPLKHPGNLKYAWMLDKKQRKHLPTSLPYLKMRDLRAA